MMNELDTEKSGLLGINVLLLEGFARQTLPIAEALHKLGCCVTTCNQSKLDIGYSSRWPDNKLIADWDRNDENLSLKTILEIIQTDKYDVVIPMTDFSASILSKNKKTLERYAKLAVNDWDIFQIAADKQNTMKVCMDNGIPCPRTLIDANNIEDVLNSDLSYPFIIKPRVGYGSIGFHRIDCEADLRKWYDTTIEICGPMLTQEYIPQTGAHYNAQFFIDKEGECKSACVYDTVRWYPVDGGSSCCGKTIDRPDIIKDGIKLLRAMGWHGYAHVDFIQDPRDDVAKVMEVNPRVTASIKLCFNAGIDFARQIVEYETDLPVTRYQDYRIGCRLRYMHTDVLWFLKSKHRFEAQPSWFDFKNTKDQIFSVKDPLPFITYTLQGLAKYKTESKKRVR